MKGKNQNNQTLLHLLSKSSNTSQSTWLIRIAQILINRGVKVDDLDNSKNQALYYASSFGQKELVKFLISKGIFFFFYYFLFFYLFIVNKGSGVDDVNSEGFTPFLSCVNNRKCFNAKPRSNLKEKFRKKGNKEDPFSMPERTISSFLTEVLSNNFAETAKLLMEHKANVNVAYKDSSYYREIDKEKDDIETQNLKSDLNEYETTPLIEAIKSKDYFWMKTLLHFKADINMCDSNMQSPLMHAIIKNDLKLVNFILNQKPDLTQKDQEGKSLIHLGKKFFYFSRFFI